MEMQWSSSDIFSLLPAIGRHRLPLVLLNLVLVLSFFIPGFIYLSSLMSFLVVGIYASFLIYEYKQAFGNFVPGFLRFTTPPNLTTTSNPKTSPEFYGFCDKKSCSRHGPTIDFTNLQPWSSINLPVSVDKALQEILDLVLKDFIYVWYSELSQDESFVNELRISLRHMLAVLYLRIEKVDLAELIVYDVVDIGVKHLHSSLRSDNGDEIAQLRDFGTERHLAMNSRTDELKYLRLLSRRLLPFILPPNTVECKSLYDLLTEILSGIIILPLMDIIANPNIVNKLLLLLFEDAQKLPILEEEKSNFILTNFTKEQERLSDLPNFFQGLTLPLIQKDTEMLFTFMQFLKCEQSINVLQCYLAIETINGRLLNPDLTKDNLAELQCELFELYRVHFSNSRGSLNFHPDIVNSIKSFCEGPAEGIAALQTSTPLFRSQDAVYDALNVLIILFLQSDLYFKFKFGDRINTRNLEKSISNRNKSSSRLRIAAKTNNLSIDMGHELLAYDPAPMSPASPASIDMAHWTVAIASVVERTAQQVNQRDATTNTAVQLRRYYVYTVRVRVQEKEWLTERLYNEFYVLEKKLNEFHGNLTTMKLPSRQTFGGKNNRNFLERRICIFQEYLNSLLTSSSLCRSELLYNFLSSNDEQFSSGPLLDIGKVTVKAALRPFIKEKGQNLDSFLCSFTRSTFTRGSHASSIEDSIESDSVSIASENLTFALYENNADIDESAGESDESAKCEMANTKGSYDAVVYLVQHVFACHWSVSAVLIGLRKLVRKSADFALKAYLSMKLRRVLRSDYSVKLIHMIRDAIFFEDKLPDTKEIITHRKAIASQQLREFIPDILVRIIGKENKNRGLQVIFDLLQKPKLNKQLSYVLLDRISIRLFPELV